MAIRLIKVDIAPSKIYSTFNVDGVFTTQEIMVVPLDGEIDQTWVRSATKITFATLTGKFSDNQYATQANGFHWVKIPNYEVIKINPEFIDKNRLSDVGIAEIEFNSVLE